MPKKKSVSVEEYRERNLTVRNSPVKVLMDLCNSWIDFFASSMLLWSVSSGMTVARPVSGWGGNIHACSAISLYRQRISTISSLGSGDTSNAGQTRLDIP
jgi:hypothetical protein